MIVLSGEQVILRRFTPDDLEVVLAGVNDPQGARLTGTHGTFDRDQIAAYIQRNLRPEADRAAFIFADIDTQRAIGEVVINEMDSDNHSANIRIAIFDPADWGRGYGTDAMRLMVTYGFETLHLHRIELGVYAFNPRAIRAYEKAGFRREGVRREALYWEGEYHDMIIMSVLEQEWPHSRSN